jgi:hypothetical protein
MAIQNTFIDLVLRPDQSPQQTQGMRPYLTHMTAEAHDKEKCYGKLLLYNGN